jgi:hypothetical protein
VTPPYSAPVTHPYSNPVTPPIYVDPPPSAAPSAAPSPAPTAVPSVSPSPPPVKIGVFCDFSTLVAGVPLTNSDQAERLRKTCKMSVTPSDTTAGTVYSNPPINIFDSGKSILKEGDDPDLGAPNRACGRIVNGQTGPGRGRGGKPLISVDGQLVDNPYKNCEPLGNLLIIQNGDISVEEKANDSRFGGCMNFEFNGSRVNLIDFGVLDVEEEIEITVRR